MKPLWNAPSLGTLRAGAQRVVTFLIILFLPLMLVLLFILAPLRLSIRSAWDKRPAWAWRTAVAISLAASLLLVAPWSPWAMPHTFPFWPKNLPHLDDFLSFSPTAYLVASVNIALTIELPLLPLLAALAFHTAWTRSKRIQ